MARRIDYLEGARVDFDESFDWYAERSVDAWQVEIDTASETPDGRPEAPLGGGTWVLRSRSLKVLRIGLQIIRFYQVI